MRRLRALSTRVPRSYQEVAESEPELAPLAKSIRLVGSVLGETMSTHSGAPVLNAVEELRGCTRSWRLLRDEGKDAEAKEQLGTIVDKVGALPARQLRDVARAFAHFLALANAAEQEHRVRRLEGLRDGALFPGKLDSCAGTLKQLVEEGYDKAEILDKLATQYVEVVLTAHPTEVHRRGLLSKHRRATELLGSLLDTEEGTYKHDELSRELRGTIHALWGSDDVRRAKPTPEKESAGGLAFIETSLWNALPSFLRRLDSVCEEHLGSPLPLDAAPVRLCSWMGGDRDGNPNVTSSVTRRVVAAQRKQGAEMFLKCLEGLRLDLSVRHANQTLKDQTDAIEPYRAIIDKLADRLRATVKWADGELDEENKLTSSSTPLYDTGEFLKALMDMHASLVEFGYQDLANGRLKDTIRRVAAFGLQLAPLDVRQESTKHSLALDALRKKAQGLSYLDLSEEEKIEWLSSELNLGRPLLRKLQVEVDDPIVKDVFETCKYMATAPAKSFAAYVISQATSAADVLAVELLLSEAGVQEMPRIAPLFETLNDLTNAPASLTQLFEAPGYLERVNYKQEVMVGYSDSAKDAGRLAALWAQYTAQEKMMDVAQKYGVELSFFHGKGGTVGRGGNPQTYAAILAHPPNTIHGRYRVTEQGEMIAWNFGEPRLAERTVDVYTAGLLKDSFRGELTHIKPEWRDAMARLAETSCATYRGVVREEPRFVPYFRAATPELELGTLNIGSRPAKRNPKGGVESLRAIPWNFSWTQTRLNLPTWLGLDALANEKETARDMYANWAWFKTNVDLLESLLARTEPVVAEAYDHRLVTDPDSLALGASLREKLDLTTNALLAITQRNAPAEDNKLLMRALKLRNPYVDVLNVIQIEALARHRALEQGDPTADKETAADLKDALLVAINGIAAGLRNSG